MLGSHFHGEIARQALTSPLLILSGLVIAVLGVVRLQRRGVWLLLAVGLLAAAHDEDGHTHWFGRRAAKPG